MSLCVKYVNWLLLTIVVIDLVFVNWALLSICVRFVLAFVCNCSDRFDILELSLPLFCVHYIISFYKFVFIFFPIAFGLIFMFVQQNNAVINFTRLFQGVPFFITICNCNYLNVPSFFFIFFPLNLFMFVFVFFIFYFLCSYFLLILDLCYCDYGRKYVLMCISWF